MFSILVRKHLETVTIVDVVSDAYIDNTGSLKAATRSKSYILGKENTQTNPGSKQIPQNWQSVLRDDDNKKEIFSFHSQQLAQ